MSIFVTKVTDIVREECRIAMLHDNMTLSRLMLYAKSIEESILKRVSRNLKRSGSSELDEIGFKRRDQGQE